MRFANLVLGTSVLGSVVGMGQAAVIVQTDFDSATVQSYANNATINSGGPTTDDLLVINAGANTTEVVAVGGGGNAFRVTRPVNANVQLVNRAAQNSAWTAAAISTGATGNNQVAISFDVTRLSTGGTAPNTLASGFRFLLNTLGETSGGNSVVQWEIQPTGVLLIRNASGTINTTTALALDTNYRVSFIVDLSNATQDTYSYKVTNLATSVDLYNVTGVTTRLANGIPDRVVFDWNGNSGGNIDADPAYLLDNVSVSASAVPEPASLAALGTAGFLSMRRRRRA